MHCSDDLIPKLLKFAQECKQDRLNTEAMKNKASTHASKYQEPIYMEFDIIQMFWCGNSPNLNIIEPCWSWMKRQTTRNDVSRTRKEAAKR